MPIITVSANDIIKDACEKLGVYAPGETLSAADSFRGESTLDEMVDQWLDDSIQLWQLSEIVCICSPNTQSYTMGSGLNNNILAPWSPRVVLGPAQAQIFDPTTGDTLDSIDIVSPLEWNAIYNPPNLPLNVGQPVAMLYDPQFPSALISFSPIPTSAFHIRFNVYYGLTGFDDLPTTYNMAPGQGLAIASNLAVLMNSYFGVGTVTPDLLAEAQQTKTLLTLTNRLSRAMSKRNVEPPTPALPKQ